MRWWAGVGLMPRRRWEPTWRWRWPTGSSILVPSGRSRSGGQKTCGDRLVKIPASALDHRRFWDAMELISDGQLQQIERRIVAGVVAEFQVDLAGLVLDMTNFATHIDSGQRAGRRSPSGVMPSRSATTCAWSVWGWWCQSMVASRWSHGRIRVTALMSLSSRCSSASWWPGSSIWRGGPAHLTLVYDAGQNSEEQLRAGRWQPAAFRGFAAAFGSSRPAGRAPKPLPGGGRPALSRDCGPLRPPRWFSGPSGASWSPTPRTCTTSSPKDSIRPWPRPAVSSAELTARLARGKGRKTRDKVEDEIALILKPRWLKRVISTTLSGTEPAELRLMWRTKAKARADLEEEIFGKRILFTDKTAAVASTAAIVADYRSQEAAESDFRQMKDPQVVSFSPMFHWTDHQIRVHVFTCVLALMVARLMVREADRAGLHLSVRAVIESLAGIEETRAALPRPARTTPSPAHAHRDGPGPAPPLRPVRP